MRACWQGLCLLPREGDPRRRPSGRESTAPGGTQRRAQHAAGGQHTWACRADRRRALWVNHTLRFSGNGQAAWERARDSLQLKFLAVWGLNQKHRFNPCGNLHGVVSYLLPSWSLESNEQKATSWRGLTEHSGVPRAQGK